MLRMKFYLFYFIKYISNKSVDKRYNFDLFCRIRYYELYAKRFKCYLCFMLNTLLETFYLPK